MDFAGPVIQLEPGNGVLGLSFGATRGAVRMFFGTPESSQRSEIGCEADQWPGVTAHYNGDDRLQALEFGPPSACMLNGAIISTLDYNEAVALFGELDQQTLSHPMATHFGTLSMSAVRGGCDAAEQVSLVLDRNGSGDWWQNE